MMFKHLLSHQIQEEMGELLDKAFNDIIALPREQVTYEVLNRVVEEDRLLENTSGWTQVIVFSHSNKFRNCIVDTTQKFDREEQIVSAQLRQWFILQNLTSEHRLQCCWHSVRD